MIEENYDYDYHNLADNSEELTDDEYYYQDTNADEPWMGLDSDENYTMDDRGWDNYYHNIADEIVDD